MVCSFHLLCVVLSEHLITILSTHVFVAFESPEKNRWHDEVIFANTNLPLRFHGSGHRDNARGEHERGSVRDENAPLRIARETAFSS